MKLIGALRPALACRGAVTRQYLSQHAARVTTLHTKRYSSLQTSPPTNWASAVDVVDQGLQVDLPKVLEHPTDVQRRKVFSSIWLRDNCRCPKCVNQQTMQRQFDTFKLSKDLRPKRATADPTHVHVEWSDGHKSAYSWGFIREYVYHNRHHDMLTPDLWDNEVHKDPPTVDYQSVMDDKSSGLAQLTMKLRKRGLCFVQGTPHDNPEHTQKLLERIAFIRQTHYGGFYDFKPDLAMADTAYTNQALALHTDNTYFTDPAGLQAFHMLSHEPIGPEGRVTGGESVLLDGFNAARILFQENRAAYRVLAYKGIPCHSSGNKGIKITTDVKYPVLEEHPVSGHVLRIRWNNDDRGVVSFGKVTPEQWYEAARKWHEIINRPELQYWFQLTPGHVLIFDNWRVLHGRSAFEGVRRICGGYINRDDFMSQWANTNLTEEENIARVMG